ncbi:hypothetical protein GCM10020255_101180 [Rhodococcus baikonurensis]
MRQSVAAAPQLPCDLGVAHTLGTVFAITRCLFAFGTQDAVLFPCAQCRRMNAETARELTHRQRWTVYLCRCCGGQSPQRSGYLGASSSLGEQRYVRTVDQAVGGLGVALVGRTHDFRGPPVPVTAAQCEESTQGLCVHWGVSPVAVVAALG